MFMPFPRNVEVVLLFRTGPLQFVGRWYNLSYTNIPFSVYAGLKAISGKINYE